MPLSCVLITGFISLMAPTLDAAAKPSTSGCQPVVPTQNLAEILRTATPKSCFALASGTYSGPVRISSGVRVVGPRTATIKSSGTGTTVRIEGDNAYLEGVTVDGSGGRFDTLDAAVHIQGIGSTVASIRVVNAVFGILAEKSARLVIRNNQVLGPRDEALGLRGDGIRLWETRESLIAENEVTYGRDIVVWYSSDNQIVDNVVTHGRYGTHLMYSHRNRVAGNDYFHDVVGLFLMYSRDVEVENNRIVHAAGAAGVGLGIKESGNLTVRRNRFTHVSVGVYLDTSPLDLSDHNLFAKNIFQLADVGVLFHSSEQRNVFRRNIFVDNRSQVRVEGGGDALGVVWEENDFDDYAGFDLDGDQLGDVPYELRDLSEDLIGRYPQLGFFRGTPALAMVNAASHWLPLLQARSLLRDPHPAMGSIHKEDIGAR